MTDGRRDALWRVFRQDDVRTGLLSSGVVLTDGSAEGVGGAVCMACRRPDGFGGVRGLSDDEEDGCVADERVKKVPREAIVTVVVPTKGDITPF